MENKTVKLANEFIRPPIWRLQQKMNNSDMVRRFFQYGQCKIIFKNRFLTEKDRGVFLCLLYLSKQHDDRPFDFRLSDIAKIKGVKNPYDKKAWEPIYESIDRLLDVSIRIRPNKTMGLSAAFTLITGSIEGDQGNISVNPYHDIVLTLMLGLTVIPLETYFSLRNSIARSLYLYLISQRNFYNGTGYKIRLSVLAEYLAYDTGEKAWWLVRPEFIKAFEELKQHNILSKYEYNKQVHKQDGGLLTFHKKENPQNIEFKRTKKNNAVVLPFKSQEFKEQWQQWKEYRQAAFDKQYGTISERVSLKKLVELSEDNEAKAIEIIEESIANGWKALFPLNKSERKFAYNNKPYRPRNGHIDLKVRKTYTTDSVEGGYVEFGRSNHPRNGHIDLEVRKTYITKGQI
jgi:hypothetical protein